VPKLTSEASFEEYIEQHLISDKGYLQSVQDNYDKTLCLRPKTVISFIRATQTTRWADYCDLIGDKDQAGQNILKRIKSVIDKAGTLYVLRNGFDIHGGGHFDLCYFEPTNSAAEEGRRLYEENLMHVQRQLYFSDADKKSLDMVIFLNGLPIFTIELKNQITGQDVRHAMTQYKKTRDPKEPLFRFKRCLAHFAVDNNLVYMTTQLKGAKTYFLPFNQGDAGGAGNPPCRTGFASSYLWESILSRPSVLDLVQRFIRVVENYDEKGKKAGTQTQIFPRYHQLSCVRELTQDAKAHGAGKRYLNQHSAGSGKTNCIAWLANSLATLHSVSGQGVFSSVIIISDRRVIDRQLQRALSQVIATKGMLFNVASDDGMTSADLKCALEDGKRIIVTTLQKFSVIVDSMSELAGERFAVIIDEAHSSQAGESAKAVQKVLSYVSLEEADEEEMTTEDRILEELKHRGPLQNISYFAFTATPKPETLQQFGTKLADGTYVPSSLYTMRQAIEESFILDVLKNYTTYDQYWSLLKKVEDDPEFEGAKAKRMLKSFVSKDERTIEKKVRIMVDHFHEHVALQLSGKAKAMIVTPSRLHAVRYRLAIDAYLTEISSPYKALVAFTDTVKDEKDGQEYTEARMNGFPETATADQFDTDSYRFLIVASKFQTGFDQPKLLAMYVDKKLSGVTCVQTLSRLNRMIYSKNKTFVLDFENTVEDIENGFQPFYDRITLSCETDPNQLYDIRTDLDNFGIHETKDVEAFAKLWFAKKPNIEKLHACADPVAHRWLAEEEDDQVNYKSYARDFVKLYSFMSSLVAFRDTNLEKMFVFLRFLIPKLPARQTPLPTEVLGMVDMEKLAIRENEKRDIGLRRGKTEVDPLNYGAGVTLSEEDKAALSQIIEDLNDRFNTSFTEDEILVIKQLEKIISEDEMLKQQLHNGSRPAVEATFRQVAKDAFEDLINDQFRFYQKVTDDEEVSKEFFDRMFEWYIGSRMKSASSPNQDRSLN
jgi:type I restriction enzyme, R subunit